MSAGKQETFCITYLINNSMSDKLMPAPSASLYFHFVVDTRYLLDLVSTIDFNGPYTANIYDKNTRRIIFSPSKPLKRLLKYFFYNTV